MAHYGLRPWSSRSRRPARQMFLPSSSNSRATAAGLIHGWFVCSRVRAGKREHLHASLALLPVDPRQADYLNLSLLIASPGEFSVLREALRHDQVTVKPQALGSAGRAKPDDPVCFLPPALCRLDPDNARWKQAGLAVSDAAGLGQCHVPGCLDRPDGPFAAR